MRDEVSPAPFPKGYATTAFCPRESLSLVGVRILDKSG